MKAPIPDAIKEMQDKILPWVRYDADQGLVVLRDDAPPEIRELRKKELEWAEEQNKIRYGSP